MARMQSGSPTPSYAWPAVIFAIASVILLIVAIVLYTQLGDAKTKAKQAQDNLLVYVTSAEQNSPAVKKYVSGSSSVVGQLINNNAELKKIIGVGKSADIKAITKKISDAKVNGSLLAEVSQLQSNVSSLSSQLQRAEGARKRAQSKQAALQKRVNALSKQYKQAAEKIKAVVQSRTGQVKQLESGIASLRKHAQKQVAQAKSELAKQISDLQGQKNKATQKADALNDKLEQIVGQTNAKGKTFATADGHISTVFLGENKVSIDRGRYDHVLLGMTFEVFPNDQSVEVTGANNQVNRGVATIQVIQVNQHSSLARIVRQSQGKIVTAGDKIINLIYSPNKTLTFVVSGKFDIDSTGKPSSSDHQRVVSMIHQWGGHIDVSLNYNVDYLILGVPPVKPQPLAASTVDAKKITRHTAAVKRYQEHQKLLEQARQMSIPVVNQNRFLTLIGYFHRP